MRWNPAFVHSAAVIKICHTDQRGSGGDKQRDRDGLGGASLGGDSLGGAGLGGAGLRLIQIVPEQYEGISDREKR